MKNTIFNNWKRYGFEFLTMFIAIVAAFALNNWQENKKDSLSENKILTEIFNGLEKDMEDIKVNVSGHEAGIAACNYFRKAFAGMEVKLDSFMVHYLSVTRDFTSLQNTAGYETLKSKGLELIDDDSLRLKVISLYEYEYSTLRKLEEEYAAMQFHQNYSKDITEALAPNFSVDGAGNLIGIDIPLKIPEDKRNELLLYLVSIQNDRTFALKYYSEIEKKITEVRTLIQNQIEK